MTGPAPRECDHDWTDQPPRHEYSRALARNGDNPELQEVSVAWVYDERCTKCGQERAWPT